MMFMILGLVNGGGFLSLRGFVVLVLVGWGFFDILILLFIWLWLLWKFVFFFWGVIGLLVIGGVYVWDIVCLDFLDFFEGGGEGYVVVRDFFDEEGVVCVLVEVLVVFLVGWEVLVGGIFDCLVLLLVEDWFDEEEKKFCFFLICNNV